MSKFVIELDNETSEALTARAAKEGIPPEMLAAEILNIMLVRPHNMNEKDMEAGYGYAAEINLDWANNYGKE